MASGPARVGALRDGREVRGVRLGAEGGLQAEVWDEGAILRSLRVPTARGPVEVCPNPPDLAGFEADGGYHGRVIGRVANRIGGARFTLDGVGFRTEANENGSTLHAGPDGWHHRPWRFEAVEADRCVLAYDSPAGEGGFPGAVRATVAFAVAADALEIVWEAQAAAPTPVAMTHHLYFNLDGPGGDTLAHRLRIAASAVTAVDARLVPTGELLPVAGTALDLREGRAMSELARADHPQLAAGGGVDLNYVLDRGDDAIALWSERSGLAMHVTTDQPGCQVYGGQGLGPPFVRYGGIALEPQAWPDAVNRPGFPPVTLRPGERYRRSARYRFAATA